MPGPHFATPEFLSAAMGTLIEGFTIDRIGEQEGHMADLFRLHLRGPATPPSIIAKCAAMDPEKRALATRYDSYRKEATLYQHAAALDGVTLPHCYYNAGPADDFLLILEDLGDESGFSHASGASREQTLQAIRTLAALHQTDTPVHAPPLEPGFVAASEDFATFVASYLDRLPASPQTALLQHYAAHTREFLAAFNALPAVLCHMDFRDDNLYWQQDELVVLDWGEYCLAPAGFDLAVFLTTSVDDGNRQAWEALMLDEYAAATRGNRHAVLDSYRLAIPHCIYLAALNDLRGNRARASGLAQRILCAVDDHLDFLGRAFT